ncbi:recombinase family protein [Aliikangiella sp. IMCC44359]|uniref:recombinase family protein n=1 Tax=Aliikangiella sp. IMCC44359 TaxID=3459125 RepID=UPI00403A83BC
MKLRVAIYARYSSDLQSDASIEDQLRLCNEKSIQQGWDVISEYYDRAISGASIMQRQGLQNLIQGAMSGKFDIVIAEALDRLSRNLHDISGLYKQLEFAGVRVFTLSEGEINTMHIGLKGTMNELFLRDLADKTRRGLRGKIEAGKHVGKCYGYRVKKQFDASGEAIKGEREIDQYQAKIINRIYHEYAVENRSPKAIAAQLNAENIPCPSGKSWGQSTINGNRKRLTGILRNPIYIGELIWNRQKFIKTPEGKRVARLNPESEWIRKNVPELRIVPQKLWEAAKARQRILDRKTDSLGAKRRPKYLLSSLLKCGCCGGGFSKHNSERYSCSNARNKGESVCNNRKTIKKDVVENVVLNALETHLMNEELVKIFTEEYTRHLNELRKSENIALKQYQAEHEKLAKEKENIIKAIKDGVPASVLSEELQKITHRQEKLICLISEQGEVEQPILHPSMAVHYKHSIADLKKLLANATTNHGEAHEHVRALIDKIVLTPKPDNSELTIDLYGDLAGILDIATRGKNVNSNKNIVNEINRLASNDNNRSVSLVAPPCYHY